MARSGGGGVPPEMAHLIEELERHCLAPDNSLLSRSVHSDLLQAKEEMLKERAKYLEAMAVYCEAIGIVEEYQQSVSSVSIGGGFNLNCSPQVYESLEHHLTVAEAAQKLRLPLLSKDLEMNETEIEKLSSSRSSFDSTTTITTTTSLSPGSTNFGSVSLMTSNSGADMADPDLGGVENRFLGVTSGYLYQSQQDKPVLNVDTVEYQRPLVREIEARLEAKCDMLTDIFTSDDTGSSSSISQISSAQLPEKVKLIIEEIEKGEALLLEDLSSMDRKFAEHYNFLEQILAVLIKFVKDLKLLHEHQYDEAKKTWLCKRCHTMNLKLSALEHMVLRDTYTKESVPALHRIRKHLIEATDQASINYHEAVTRLRQYRGVDLEFDDIARNYHDIVKKLEQIRYTIQEVERDLKQSHDHPIS